GRISNSKPNTYSISHVFYTLIYCYAIMIVSITKLLLLWFINEIQFQRNKMAQEKLKMMEKLKSSGFSSETNYPVLAGTHNTGLLWYNGDTTSSHIMNIPIFSLSLKKRI
ncbi:hypothetical protein ACJX0J_009231, partial [Zea mays]